MKLLMRFLIFTVFQLFRKCKNFKSCENCRKFLQIAANCRKLPQIAANCQKLNCKNCENCRKLSKIAANCRKLHHIADTGYKIRQSAPLSENSHNKQLFATKSDNDHATRTMCNPEFLHQHYTHSWLNLFKNISFCFKLRYNSSRAPSSMQANSIRLLISSTSKRKKFVQNYFLKWIHICPRKVDGRHVIHLS